MARILIVDDEPLVRDALKRVLEEDGWSVDIVADAKSALDRLAAQPYTLAIVDIIMPDMDGVELIRTLRQGFPALRVVAISGGGNFELSGYSPEAMTTRTYLAAARSVGADAVLAKPFDMEELLGTIRPLLAPA